VFFFFAFDADSSFNHSLFAWGFFAAIWNNTSYEHL
jgi:hypothetical protein